MAKRTYSHSLPLPPLYNYLLLGLGALAVLVIILVVYYSFSQATIIVKPAWQEQKVGLIANIIDQKNSTTTAGQISGYSKIYEKEVSDSFLASSSTSANAPIVGVIEIINKNSKPQALVASTRFLTADNLLFHLNKTVTIPAGSKIEATLTAAGNEDKYLIGANQTRLTIPGLWPGLQNKIYGQTLKSFNRAVTNSYNITQENLAGAQDALQQKAMAEIKAEIAKTEEKVNDNQIIITENSFKADDTVNALGQFKAGLKIKVNVIIFDASQLPELAAKTVPEIYKSPNIKINLLPDSFSYQLTPLDANSENLIAQIRGDYKLKMANYSLSAAALAGLKKTEVLELLKNNNQYESYQIKLPFWSGSLPKDLNKIKIIFE